MTAIIKSGSATTVSAIWPNMPPPAPAADPRDAEHAALVGEIKRLREALADAEAGADSDAAQAHARGVAEGKEQAASRDAEHLELLAATMHAAHGALATRLEALDALAPLLVRAAHDKIFGACTRWDDAVAAMIARQLETLRRSSVIAIHVSPSDFHDEVALARIASGELRIERDAALRSGGCRIECKLGEVDMDARSQLAALANLLDGMAR